jgi:hypothetical protein
MNDVFIVNRGTFLFRCTSVSSQELKIFSNLDSIDPSNAFASISVGAQIRPARRIVMRSESSSDLS